MSFIGSFKLNVFCILLILPYIVFAEYNCEYKKDGFYPDEDFCHIYWRCNYGVSEEYECPAGTAWNHLEGRCDWLDNVDCTRRDSEGNKKEPKEEEEEEREETTKRSKTKKPAKTTPPVDEQTPEVMNNFDADFDDEKKNDNSKNPLSSQTNGPSVNNPGSSSVQCQSFGSYYTADPANCASYYMCNNGKESKMQCAEKQLFNTETSQCEDFQSVFCGTRAVNLAEKNQCQAKRDGIFPDMERNCKVFYQCLNQQKVREANCPNQLKFNSLTGRCDNPNNIISPCGTYSTSSSVGISASITLILLKILSIIITFR